MSDDYGAIPVLINNEEIFRTKLPQNWIHPGVNKISQVSDISGMDFNAKDFIGSTLINPRYWENIRNNKIYEIITRTGDSLIRRVRNEIDSLGQITYFSDNNEGNTILDIKDIEQLWEINFKVT